MTKFFTADHHFGHSSIIKFCNRPFSSVEEMDAEMVRRWNERVGAGDEVYHLGDFAFRARDRYVQDIFHSLNGRKHLIRGNHDNKAVERLPWESVSDIKRVQIDGQKASLVLCHYKMAIWPKSHWGALHFYGHSHGKAPITRNSFDVGVDVFDFRPVTFEEVLEKIRAAQVLKQEPEFEPRLDE